MKNNKNLEQAVAAWFPEIKRMYEALEGFAAVAKNEEDKKDYIKAYNWLKYANECLDTVFINDGFDSLGSAYGVVSAARICLHYHNMRNKLYYWKRGKGFITVKHDITTITQELFNIEKEMEQHVYKEVE